MENFTATPTCIKYLITMKNNHFLRTGCLLFLTLFSAGQVFAQNAALTPAMRALLSKNESFGLGKYPISFWSYTNLEEHGRHMTESEVKSWADAGFTVPQSPGFESSDQEQKAHIIQLLDWAQKYGMKLIVTDPRGYAKGGEGGKPADNYADGVKAAVRDFGQHPALFGFHVGDEPDADFKNVFFECLKIQKELAPHLHPFANLLPHFPGIEKRAGTDNWPNYLDEYARKTNADMVGYDCYAQMNPGEDGWNDYFRNLKFHREAAVRNGIPFWNTILSVGHFNYRVPSQDDLRWQFNTSLAGGANGIAWFFYYMRQPHANYRMSPVDEFWNKTPMYYDLQRIQNAFHRHYGDLFNKLVATRVSFYGKSYGDGESFTPDSLISGITNVKGVNSLMVSEFMDATGRRYVMLVNNSTDKNCCVRVSFPRYARTFSWDWYGKEYEGTAYCGDRITNDSDGNQLHTLWLAPGQEAVYRVAIDKSNNE
jgi:hypothetical protein